jgi:hypothetical protein
MVKMTSFLVQMVKFKFKWNTWINQETTPHYRLPALGAGSTTVGTARASSKVGGTTRPGRPQTLSPARPATSTWTGATDWWAGAIDPGVGINAARWNQPKPPLLSVDLCECYKSRRGCTAWICDLVASDFFSHPKYHNIRTPMKKWLQPAMGRMTPPLPAMCSSHSTLIRIDITVARLLLILLRHRLPLWHL